MRSVLQKAQVREDTFHTPPSVYEFIVGLVWPTITSLQKQKIIRGDSDDEGNTQEAELPKEPLYLMELFPVPMCTAVLFSKGVLPLRIVDDARDKVRPNTVVALLQEFISEEDLVNALMGLHVGKDVTNPDLTSIRNNLPRALHGTSSRPLRSTYSQSNTPRSEYSQGERSAGTPRRRAYSSGGESQSRRHSPSSIILDNPVSTTKKRSPPRNRHHDKSRSKKQKHTSVSDSQSGEEVQPQSE